jgi:hypothetical protein
VDSLRVPADDPTVIVTEHPEGTVLQPAEVGDRFTMIKVEMFAGRSLDAKRKLYNSIVDRLGDVGVPGIDVLIVLNEIPMTDWGIEGGVPACDLDVGFKVDV